MGSILSEKKGLKKGLIFQFSKIANYRTMMFGKSLSFLIILNSCFSSQNLAEKHTRKDAISKAEKRRLLDSVNQAEKMLRFQELRERNFEREDY